MKPAAKVGVGLEVLVSGMDSSVGAGVSGGVEQIVSMRQQWRRPPAQSMPQRLAEKEEELLSVDSYI
ncbi:MAG: hypothetical protein U0Z26_17550 [Anaerolineales bacterium]